MLVKENLGVREAIELIVQPIIKGIHWNLASLVAANAENTLIQASD